MTEPEPVSMSWAELLNIIYGIFGVCEKDDVAAPVATSQQNEGKEQDNEQNGEQEKQVEKAEDQNEQEAAGIENEESRESRAQGEACADSEPAEEPSADPEPADESPGASGGAGEDSDGGSADGEGDAGVAPVQPESDQLKGQINITDYPEYMPDTETDGQEKSTEAAGVEEEAEKPEKTRTEAETAWAASVDFTDTTGLEQYVEKQKTEIIGRIRRAESLCADGKWGELVKEAGDIITIAKSVMDMVEVWDG